MVFGDAAARTWLEALIHPLVRDALARWRTDAAAAVPPPRALVEEVALLLESGRPAEYDHIVVIVADDSARRARIAARGHLEGLGAREARLLTDEGRIVHADTVIRNDGDFAALEAAVRDCLERVTTR